MINLDLHDIDRLDAVLVDGGWLDVSGADLTYDRRELVAEYVDRERNVPVRLVVDRAQIRAAQFIATLRAPEEDPPPAS